MRERSGENLRIKGRFLQRKAMRAVQMKERQEKINEMKKRKKEEEARLRKYFPEKIEAGPWQLGLCFRPNQKSYQWVSRFFLFFSFPPSFC